MAKHGPRTRSGGGPKAFLGRGGRAGYCRAEFARVAAILLIDEVLTKPVTHDLLKKVARAYDVPAIVPHSTRASDYRDLIYPEEAVLTDAEIRKFFE